MTRWLVLALVGALVVAGCSTAGGAVPQDALARFENQRVDWQGCSRGPDDEIGRMLDGAGAQCATITVPLHYGVPAGATTTVALSRMRADPAVPRTGVLLLNRGGPGETSVPMPPSIRAAMGTAGRGYDVIGVDPRFVGRAEPLDCGWPTTLWMRAPAPGRAAFDASVVFQRDLAERCRQRHAAVLPHVTTRNTARDLDVVRAVLGEKRISFLCYSYGTYLGAVYAQMFPDRVDRMVLDSAVDPRRWSATAPADALGDIERGLAGWAAWVAGRDAEYGLGTTPEAVLATVGRILRTATAHPLAVGPHQVNGEIVPLVLRSGLGDDRDEASAELAQTVQVLAAAADGRAVTAPEGLEMQLRFLLTGAMSSYGSVGAAVTCNDRAVPTG